MAHGHGSSHSNDTKKRKMDERLKTDNDDNRVEEFDAGAIQARLDISMAMVDELVESWMVPSTSSSGVSTKDSNSTSGPTTTTSQPTNVITATPLVARYPGLGLGAKPSSLSEKRIAEAKLRSKLLPNSKKGQRQQQQQQHQSQQKHTLNAVALNHRSDDDDDEEESRTKAISSSSTGAATSSSSKQRNSFLSAFDTAAVSKKKRKQMDNVKGKEKEVEHVDRNNIVNGGDSSHLKEKLEDRENEAETQEGGGIPSFSEVEFPDESTYKPKSEETRSSSSPSKKQHHHKQPQLPHSPMRNRDNVQHPNITSSIISPSPSKKHRRKEEIEEKRLRLLAKVKKRKEQERKTQQQTT